jgi:hypothetical protein
VFSDNLNLNNDLPITYIFYPFLIFTLLNLLQLNTSQCFIKSAKISYLPVPKSLEPHHRQADGYAALWKTLAGLPQGLDNPAGCPHIHEPLELWILPDLMGQPSRVDHRSLDNPAGCPQNPQHCY